MILVTGATGTVGRVVVDRLVKAGQSVRALTRNPERAGLPDGVDVVRGDLTRPEDLAGLFDGVQGVFYLAVMDQEETEAVRLAEVFLGLAAKAGVRRVVDMTGLAVTMRRAGSYEMLLALEQAVEASGLEWTHVRPGEFAVNKIDTWAHSIGSEGVVRNAYPDGLGSPVHEADIAEVAVTALLEDGHAGKAYSISGPEVLSHREQAAAIAEGIGRPLRFEALTYGQARRSYIEMGMPAFVAEYILGYQAEYAEEPPTVSPDVEKVLGRPGRTLAQWAADHKADLG